MEFKIGTRKSILAQEQADFVIKLMKQELDIEAEKFLIETTGDKILDVTLDKIGGKGLFLKEIEYAMQEGRINAAVHSMKDVPFELPQGFEIVAMPSREDVRDAFISAKGHKFSELREGAVIGTSSARRAVLLKDLRPDLVIVPIRGNVQTRLKKMEIEGLDGIVLAAAGLKRLGLENIISDYFDEEVFIPAIGQGALGIEVLEGDDSSRELSKLDDKEIRECVEAERSFMRRLEADCHTAVGAYAHIEGEEMIIHGMYHVDGILKRKSLKGDRKDHLALGSKLADLMLL